MKLPLWAEYMAKAAFEADPKSYKSGLGAARMDIKNLMAEQPETAKAMEAAFKGYAQECVEASLKAAADNATTIFVNKEQTSSKVHKPSITHESNIILL